MKLPLELLYDIVFYLDYRIIIDLFPNIKFLKIFDISKMRTDSSILLIGKEQNSLVKDIIYHKRNELQTGMIISKTQNNYKYNTEILSNFLEIQYNKLTEDRNRTNHCLIFMDDFDSKWSNEKSIQTIFFYGRHYKIMFLLTMQTFVSIPIYFRSNIDYVFLTKNSCNVEIEKIYKNYAIQFKSLKEFKLILDLHTKNNNVLVIDITGNSNKLEETVFFYKAESHENFKMF